MSPIQLILIGGCVLCLLLYLRSSRSILIDRAIALLLFGLGLLAIIFPSKTTAVANFLGVGRGVDLFLYLFILGVVFIAILFYRRLNKLEQRYTSLVRKLALDEADAVERTNREPHEHSG